MAIFQRKSGQVEAIQWIKVGDHPDILECDRETYIRLRDVTEVSDAFESEKPWRRVGICSSSKGVKYLINSGDWIVSNEHGEEETCPRDIFEQTYEAV